ncbi:MAG: S-layer homology domain-containing protein [Patescibacteria group bacterium]
MKKNFFKLSVIFVLFLLVQISSIPATDAQVAPVPDTSVKAGSYNTEVGSIPSCPTNSFYDAPNKICRCGVGYVTKDGASCINGELACKADLGSSSLYNADSKKCECGNGYGLDHGQCKSLNAICQAQFGDNALSSGVGSQCQCQSGYNWNTAKTSCEVIKTETGNQLNVIPTPTVPGTSSSTPAANTQKQIVCLDTTNGYLGTDNQCYCKEGFRWNDASKKCMALSKQEIEQQTQVEQKKNIFADIDQSVVYKDAIEFLYGKKIVNGFDDGTFRPYEILKRAELIKIAVTAKYGQPSNDFDTSCFRDVPKNQWFTKYVCFAKKNEIIKGYKNANMKPMQYITYAESLKILMETFKYSVDKKKTPWYQGYLESAEALGLNIPAALPDEAMSRSTAAELISRFVKAQQ